MTTEHDPHSPSPHPSFVPVNPKCWRNTSNNLSVGYTRRFRDSPLTVNATSHCTREAFTDPRLTRGTRDGPEGPQTWLRKDPRAEAESSRLCHRERPQWHSRSLEPAHQSATRRSPSPQTLRVRCPVPRSKPGSGEIGRAHV